MTRNGGLPFSRQFLALALESLKRQALLKIKQDLKDSSNSLADWRTGNGDCCIWVGVFCDKATGHVTELQLGGSNHGRLRLGGKLNPALLDLKSLSYLDLSNNDFDL
ncbi:hypothetical protein F3Y22_tig00112231pilonHSYRG00149 [Hibiscus syriacus]|uniref:Leucine-rich repeat-containing N-terminal plant-type domain-containing protein n=1 Tax=Hibiscus syriacus TaxID=106335 RepID=A0A6A2YB24_HIBSY|nr:hypothetical protein F3Y22_tig00112231pilonHSYRG00149 [Hibiscus syriacus]